MVWANSGDQVWVAAGIYRPDVGADQISGDREASFALKENVAIYGGFSGGETLLEQRDSSPETNGTVLSGDLSGDDGAGDNSENAYHVLVTTSLGRERVAGRVYDNGGNANGADAAGFGGGVYNDSGSPTIQNCTFSGNHSDRGGAVVNAQLGSGTFRECLFVANTSATVGGAIYNVAGSTPVFTACEFETNEAVEVGGACANFGASPVFERCRFSGNAGAIGGAIYSALDSTVQISESSFIGNTANVGRAAYNNAAPVEFENCVFKANTAFQGGALGNFEAAPVLTNCGFAGNAGSQLGGAVINTTSSPTFTNCSFSANSSRIGSAIYNAVSSNPVLTNCIVWKNLTDENTSTYGIQNQDSSPTYSHCILYLSGGSAFWDDAFGVDGGNNLASDPQFLDGGIPQLAPSENSDLRLAAGSPAVDSGDGGDGASSNGSWMDLAGQSRFNGTVDLGCYEGGYARFDQLYAAIDPSGDANANGFSNFTDYALGADPIGARPPARSPIVSVDTLTFYRRAYALDLATAYQRSPDLTAWLPMVEGLDYVIESTAAIGEQESETLRLLAPQGDTAFFRQMFSEVAE